MQSDPILTCVRIKPTAEEGEVVCKKIDEKSIVITKNNEKYIFEQIFDETDDTKKIYNVFCKDLIEECFKGINVCIFAYGQTASGKTYTMRGIEEHPGIIPLAIKQIFSKANETSTFQVELKFSYLELYNEMINDLFQKENVNLDLREHPQRGIIIQGISEIQLKQEEEASNFFLVGEANRKFGETAVNEESSRSHTVFRVQFEIRPKERPDKVYFSFLNLIDLAGSEGVARAKTEGARKKEGNSINKSLLALSNVISTLSQRLGGYVNYRDSKLTRILQSSLGGNSKTAVICTINPLNSNYQESLNTLKFGMNAGAIKNQIKANEKLKLEENVIRKEMLENHLKEIEELKKVLIQKEETIKLIDEKLTTLQNENSFLSIQSGDLSRELFSSKQENSIHLNKIDNLTDLVARVNREKENLEKNNKELSDLLHESDTNPKKSAEPIISKIHEEKEIQTCNSQDLQVQFEEKKSQLIEEIKILNNKICTMTTQFNLELKNKEKEIANLKMVAEKINNEEKNKENIANNLNFSQAHYNFDDNKKINDSFINQVIDNGNLDELQLLELSYHMNLKMYQKNETLTHLRAKISKLELENREKNDLLSEMKNDLLYYKNLNGNNTIMNNTLNLSSIDPLENSVLNVSKRKKVNDYSFVEKKINTSPDIDQMKREIKYLENKNRNYERQLARIKLQETENYKKIEALLSERLRFQQMIKDNSLNISSLLDL